MTNPSPLTAAELMRQLGFRFPTARAAATLEPPVAPRPAALARSSGPVPLEPRLRRTLHVTNGDGAAAALRLSGIAGEVSITADLLHEGPAPGGLPPERWRKVRARYLAESGYGDYDSCLLNLTRWDHTLEDHRTYDEVILWFEHDLFDQLLLIRALAGFAGRSLGATELSLICIGEFPGVEPFHGLGQLTPQQMATLLPQRQRVLEGQKLLARDAWRGFCSPDPTSLEAILARGTAPLPYLAGALRRHLEEFPGTADGLSRTERQILRVLRGGAAGFEELFRATQAMEERVFRGDASFDRVLRELTAPPRPLVRLEPAGSPTRGARISLTLTGREVLEGKDDWVRIRGIDRWLGGVFLQGVEAAWRWDAETERLARS